MKTRAAKISVAIFFIAVLMAGTVVVAAHTPPDCTDNMVSSGQQTYLASSCNR